MRRERNASHGSCSRSTSATVIASARASHGSAKTGPKAKLWSTNVATSADLIHWEKYAGNPLLPVEQNRSSGIVVRDGDKFRLYTMHPAVHLHLPAR